MRDCRSLLNFSSSQSGSWLLLFIAADSALASRPWRLLARNTTVTLLLRLRSDISAESVVPGSPREPLGPMAGTRRLATISAESAVAFCLPGTKSSAEPFLVTTSDIQWRNMMARDEHNKAAEHHENAAKAHRAAAEHHGKGDHAKAKEHSASAQQHSQNARQHSEQAHSKSQQQK
jgi:hypothetical protein